MMLKNYVKTGIRNLLKHKLFSITNIVGLSIGVLCCLMIMMYVAHESSYDQWNPKLDRLVRPYADINFGGTVMTMAVTGAPLAPDAQAILPEVEDWCRIRDYGSYLVKVEGSNQQNLLVDNVLSVDSTFLNLFPLPLLAGDPVTCLTSPQSLLISEQLAAKLFNSIENAVGTSLRLDNDKIWRITGVYRGIPATTHFKADLLLSLNGNREIAESPTLWASNNNFHTYLLLREGTDFTDFSNKFEKLSREKIEITSSTLLGMSLEDFEKTGQYARYPVQKVADIHLHSNLTVELEPNGDVRYVWIFSAVALIVLLIACINFMNLTTAKASQRVKEISVRKVMGSSRKQLIFQFLTESMLMAFISVSIAVVLSIFLLPWYSQLTGTNLQLPWQTFKFWMLVVGGVFLVGGLAGSYPAFFLSSFQPIQVLRNGGKGRSRDEVLRNTLVVFQFVVATTLIIGTLLIYQQINFIQNKKVGFQKDQIIVVNDTYTLGDKIQSFKVDMLKHPSIRSATISSYLPIPSSRSSSTYSKARQLREDLALEMSNWWVDYDYAETYGLQLKEGRFFDRSFGIDSQAVVLNEAAIAVLGYDQPVGKKIYGLNQFQGAPQAEDFQEYTIIGVMKDFHFESLRDNIGTLGLFLGRSTGNVSFSFQAGNTAGVIAALEDKWNQMAPDQPFAYRFVDQAFSKMYEAESRIGTIILVFAVLAILVSCLGLFGLSTFVVEQRTKEIGIRKVLGANVANIVGLLSRQFLLLVLLGIIIAVPISWYFLKSWLTNFAYRIEMHWSVFLAAAVLAILIAFFTVGFQSIKAAMGSPALALKDE